MPSLDLIALVYVKTLCSNTQHFDTELLSFNARTNTLVVLHIEI